MNAFQYMKNASKGVAYASKEVWKKYNPTAAALASSAAQMGSELNQSIKNLKESAKGDDTYFKAGKEAGKEYVSNLLSDLKTGNWYNTQRQEEASNEMLKNMGFGDMMDFNMDFDMDDFGDDLDKSGVSETVKKQISSEQQSTKAMVTGMDVVGGKVSGALSTASAKSAQYIASVQMQTSKALYDLTSKGFAGVSVGIASINTNVTSLVEFTKPLSAHLQSVEEYNATSLSNQQKALELLKKISDNTTPVSAKQSGTRKKNINDIITGGVLDIDEYKEMLKEQFSIVTSLGSMFLGKDSLFSGLGMTKKGTINMALGTESPMLNILGGLFSLLVPKKAKDAQKNLDTVLANFLPALFSKIQKSNKFGSEILKMFFMPDSGYKSTLNTGNYTKGKVDWDGISRKALTEVIPYQLSLITAAVTHKPQQIYDYNNGKWKTVGELKSGFENIKNTYADANGRDYIHSAEKTINNMRITSAQKKSLKEALRQYNRNRYHNVSNPMEGLGQDFITYWTLYQKAQSSSKNLEYEGQTALGQSSYGDKMRSMESEGTSVYNVLFNDAQQIDEDERASTLLGVDKDKNDIFFYLRGIYQNTMNASTGAKPIVSSSTTYTSSGKKNTKNYSSKKNKNKSSKEKSAGNFTDKDVANALLVANSQDDYDEDKFTGDPEIDNYITQRDAKEIPVDQKMENKIKIAKEGSKIFGKNSNLRKNIKNKHIGGVYDKIEGSIEKVIHKPLDAMTGLLDAASESMENILLGTGKGGLKEWFKTQFQSTIDNIKQWFVKSPLYAEMKKSFGSVWKFISGGIGDFGDMINLSPEDYQAKQAAKAGEVPAGGATTNYNGSRYVSKTGVVAVSKGEMIVPAELNPYYNGPIDKAKQRETELASIDDFYGSFRNGKKSVGYNSSRKKNRGKKVKTDKNGNIISKAKGIGKAIDAAKVAGGKAEEAVKSGAKNVGDFIYTGASNLYNGFMSIIGGLMPGDEKAVDKEKKGISSVIKAALQDAGASKGAIAAGAVIGGGASLLTGGLIGPILGASIGAATGLIVKSNAVQDALFGKIDEKTGERGGQDTGGLLSKNMTDFMTKNVPHMGRGAAIGGIGGLFMGSPVMGAILGSAVGYVSSSTKAKNFLFGTEDEKTGERRNNGIIKQNVQKAFKERIPGMSAGAIAGLLAGPFGLAGNIIVGSTIGYVASGEKFKSWLLGEKDENGKRKKEGSFVELLKKNLVEPIVDIFANVGNKISQDISNHMKNLEKRLRDRIAKTLGKGFSRLGGFVWNGMRKVIPALPETPVNIVGNGLKGIRNHIVNKNLKKGYNVFDASKGRNLTASERIDRRNKSGKTALTGSFYQSADELLSKVGSKEELSDFETMLDKIADPTKTYTKDLSTARGNVRDILRNNFEENLSDTDKANGKKAIDRKTANQLQSMLRKGDWDGAKKLAGNLGLDQDSFNKLSSEIDNQASAQAGIKEASTNAEAAKQKILDASGYKGKLKAKDLTSDNIYNLKTLAETEKGAERFTPEKMQEKAVTDVIPNLLKQILGVMVKDPKTMGEVAKDLNNSDLKNAAEKVTGPSPTATKAEGNIASGFGVQHNESAAVQENIASGFGVIHDESAASTSEEMAPDGIHKLYIDRDGKKYVYSMQEKDYVLAQGDTQTRETVKAETEQQNSIKSLPVMSKALEGISGILGTFKTKLFGTGEGEKKKGLFGSLLGILTGEDSKSPLKSIFSWIVGKTGLSSIFTKIFGGITLKGVLSDALVVGLLAAATNGVFDNIFANFPGYGKKKNSTTYNAKTGSGIATNDDGSIKTDANGNPIDNKGKVVDIKDVNYKITDQMSLSQRFKYNLGRGLFTGTGSVLQVGLKYGTKLGSKLLPKNFGTMSIYDAIQKVMNAIKGIKTPGVAENLKNVDLDGMGKQIGDQAVKNSGGAAKTVSSTMFIVAIALAVYDFMDGYEDASTTLKIQNPTIGESIACGITRALKNAVPVVGTFVPDEQIIGIAMMYFEEQGLVNKKKLQQQQASAEQARVKYNTEHGTNYDWAQVNKSGFENYTWLERTKNLLGSDWTRLKLRVGKDSKTANSQGFSGLVKSKVADFKSIYNSTFKSTNDVGSALAEGTKEATGSESVGLVTQLTNYALSGKFKQFLTLEPAEFKKNLANKDAVDPGIFSKLMGQMYLYGFKFMLMPVAGATGTVRGIADWYQSKVVDPLKTDRANFEKSKEDVLKQTTVGGIWKVKGEFSGALGTVFNTSLFMQKLFSTPVVLLKEVMNTFPNVLKDVGSWIKDKFDWITGKKKSDDTTNTDTTANDTSAGGSFISQNNPAYAKKKIGRSNVGALGCGPAAAYMALNMSAGRSNTMNNAINVANKYQTGTGTDAAYFGDYFGRNGASASYYDASSAGGQTGIINNLRSNRPTILMGQDSNNTSKTYSPFGPNNHYVVASGFDRSGNVIVNDPEANRGGIKYNPSILRNVKMGIGVSGGGSRLRRFGISGGGQQVYSHSLRNDPTTQAVWKFLKSKGYTDYAAAGVMGNMQQESGIDPTVVNSIGAHGICQWLNGRWTKLQAYAKSKGTDWTDLQTQLEYADQEISSIGGLGDNYKKSTANASECAKQFEAKFEISGGSALAKREQYAEYYYKQFVDNSGALGYTPGGNLLGSTGIVNYSNTADRATLARTNSKATLGSTVTDTSNAVTKGKISGSNSNGSKGKGNVMGILTGIMNAFGKIGDIFTGSDTANEDTTATDTTGTGDTGSIVGSIGDSVDELTSKLPNSTGASPIGRKAVAYMDSIKGTIPYSMTGARNPEKGSEDCSSSVQWAIKKAGGPDIGGYTGAQSSSKYLNTVWKGRNPSSLPSNIKPGDVMFFTRKYSTNNPTYPDDIGHVGMYMGDGKLIDHGSGMGPKIKDMTSSSFINDSSYGMPTLRQVSRLYDATSNSGTDTTSYSNSADRASLAKTAIIGPAKKGQISGSGSGLIGLQGDGGDSGLTPTAINNTKGKSSSIMSKDTAALLKVIITLIESLVDNTKRNNDIYDIIKQYCGNAGAKGVAASAAVDALKSKSSGTDTVEKSLASLKTSIDEILAS